MPNERTLLMLPSVLTLIVAVPAVARSAVEIEACNCVGLTKVVVRIAPFQRTTDVAVKPDPLMVRVSAAEPAAALLG